MTEPIEYRHSTGSRTTIGTWQHLYLQQPGYGTSYLMGKVEIDHILARKLASGSTLRQFMDEKDASGLIPVSLLRWELTGDRSGVPGLKE